MIEIYTDGACKGNPGKGGWGVFVKQTKEEIFGGESLTTNNRMELTAVIKTLEYICLKNCKMTNFIIFTDSQYVYKGITEWMKNWKKNGWKNSKKQTVVNVDLWKQFDDLAQKIENVAYKWVRGHCGNEGNEMADLLANKGTEL